MNQNKRILIGVGILALIALAVLGVDALRRSQVAAPAAAAGQIAPAVTLTAGSVPVYFNGQLIAGFSPQELDKLEKVSFTEPVEGKEQDGWLLRDVLLLYLKPEQLKADTQVIVSSTSRNKSAQLTWAEIDVKDNMVMFDLSNRGTLKLASKLEKLDTRDEWVQDVDKIEVSQP